MTQLTKHIAMQIKLTLVRDLDFYADRILFLVLLISSYQSIKIGASLNEIIKAWVLSYLVFVLVILVARIIQSYLYKK